MGGLSFTSPTNTSTVAEADWVETGLVLTSNTITVSVCESSASCTTKPLSKLLTHCLKLILKHYKEYCKGIERRTGVNCFWVINNSTKVTNTLDKLRHARALDSFDFSTLYTNTPHSQLKTRMEEVN